MDAAQSNAKLEHLRALLAFHGSAFLHVTPGPDARLPSHLEGRQTVPLVLTTETDFHADEWGFSATLVFGLKRVYVTVPWGSVWSIVDERSHGVVYQEAGAPRAQVIDFFAARKTTKRGRPTVRGKGPRNHLRVV